MSRLPVVVGVKLNLAEVDLLILAVGLLAEHTGEGSRAAQLEKLWGRLTDVEARLKRQVARAAGRRR